MNKKISKLEIDLKQSDVALLANHEKMEKANMYLASLDAMEAVLREDPLREAHILLIKKRIGHLLNKMLDKPLDPGDPKNLLWHGEMRGRLMEQILHANTLSGIEKHRNFLLQAKDRIIKAIEGIAKKTERKAGDK